MTINQYFKNNNISSNRYCKTMLIIKKPLSCNKKRERDKTICLFQKQHFLRRGVRTIRC